VRLSPSRLRYLGDDLTCYARFYSAFALYRAAIALLRYLLTKDKDPKNRGALINSGAQMGTLDRNDVVPETPRVRVIRKTTVSGIESEVRIRIAVPHCGGIGRQRAHT
jgi:hypothetical protein